MMADAMTANIIVLAATCSGIRWHNESGQGKEEDAVKTAAEMSLHSGAGGEEQHNKEGGGGRQEVPLLLRRMTTTTGGIFLLHTVGRRTLTTTIAAIKATIDV